MLSISSEIPKKFKAVVPRIKIQDTVKKIEMKPEKVKMVYVNIYFFFSVLQFAKWHYFQR